MARVRIGTEGARGLIPAADRGMAATARPGPWMAATAPPREQEVEEGVGWLGHRERGGVGLGWASPQALDRDFYFIL